jgi:hypothetical protein
MPPVRKLVRRLVLFGVVAGIAVAVWRRLATPGGDASLTWTPQPAPFPPAPTVRPAPPPAAPAAWVEPGAGGACPLSHPVKAKLASGIFHVPDGASYERTRADRCYRDPDAAVADGLRPSKR